MTPAAPSFGLLACETVTFPLPVTGAFFIEVVEGAFDGGFAAPPEALGGLTPGAPSFGRLASEMVFLPLVTPFAGAPGAPGGLLGGALAWAGGLGLPVPRPGAGNPFGGPPAEGNAFFVAPAPGPPGGGGALPPGPGGFTAVFFAPPLTGPSAENFSRMPAP